MFQQRALHFEWADSVAGGNYYVIGTAHEPEIAVDVADGLVAGQIPFAAEDVGGLFRVFPVLEEQRRRPLRGHAGGPPPRFSPPPTTPPPRLVGRCPPPVGAGEGGPLGARFSRLSGVF